MAQDLLAHGFKWVFRNEKCTPIAKLVKQNRHGCQLEADVNYPETLYDKHNELPFLSERMMIRKVETLVQNLKDKRK